MKEDKEHAAEIRYELAVMYDLDHHDEKAGKAYEEALEIYRALAKENPLEYRKKVVKVCDCIAHLNLSARADWDTVREERLKEALETYLASAIDRPEEYNPDYAGMFYEDLVSLYQKNGRDVPEGLYQEISEVSHAAKKKMDQEALEKCRVLAGDHPSDFQEELAKKCRTLAFDYEREGRFADAEKLQKEALGIYKKLEKENPGKYGFRIACTSDALVRLLRDTDRYSEIEILCKESLKQYRKLAADPDYDFFKTNYADACRNLAMLYEITGRQAEAEALYRKADDLEE